MQSEGCGNRKVNQAYISTGLQIINAVEYIYASGKQDDENVLVICTIKPQLIKEIKSVLNLFNWTRVYFLFPNWILSIRNYYIQTIIMTIWGWLKLNRIYNATADYILGHDQNLYCKFVAKKAGNSRITLLDDGVGSIAFKENDSHYETYSRVNKLRNRFFGVSKFMVKFDRFFTSYKNEIEARGITGIVLMVNSYAHLKSLAKNKQSDNRIFFIGDPLVERNAISEEDYFRQIEEVKVVFGENLYYVPRISEDALKLQKLSGVVKILQPDVPFEIFLIKGETLPKALIGYHTSVLFNSNNLFGSSIELYHIKLKVFTRAVYKSILPDIYKALDLISNEWPAA